jgi:hypothetical protein
MATTGRHRENEETKAGQSAAMSPRDERWNERLRLVGDARFVEVQWSGRDNPCWPLPKK